jgi:hypothetical protein
MDDQEWLAERFEEHRPHLRAVAYRMLGSLTEAASGRWSTPSWPRPARGDLEALVAVLDPDVVLRAESAGRPERSTGRRRWRRRPSGSRGLPAMPTRCW